MNYDSRMERGPLLELLIETAGELGIEVRRAGRGDTLQSEPAPRSGVCKVAGNPWVVLATDDPVEFQIELLAGAVREIAGSALEARYLPPAVRTVIAGAGTS